MTPTKKGLYEQCENCIHKVTSTAKYPCAFSHSMIRKNSNSNLEREFHTCGLKEIKENK